MVHVSSFLDVILAVRGIQGLENLSTRMTKLKHELRGFSQMKIDLKASSLEEFKEKTKGLRKELGQVERGLAKIKELKAFNKTDITRYTDKIAEQTIMLKSLGAEEKRLNNQRKNLKEATVTDTPKRRYENFVTNNPKKDWGNFLLQPGEMKNFNEFTAKNPNRAKMDFVRDEEDFRQDDIKSLQKEARTALNPNGDFAKKWLSEKIKGTDLTRQEKFDEYSNMNKTNKKYAENGILKPSKAGIEGKEKMNAEFNDALNQELERLKAASKKYNEAEAAKVKAVTDKKTGIDSRLSAIAEEKKLIIDKQGQNQKDLATEKEKKTNLQDRTTKLQGQARLKNDMIKKEKTAGLAELGRKLKALFLDKASARAKLDALEATKSELKDMSDAWASVSYFMSKVISSVKNGLMEIKNMQLANVFSQGATSGLNPYTQGSMGADMSEFGEVAKFIARSPYAKEFSSNIGSLVAYTKLTGESAQQVLPIASGMQSNLGDKYASSTILNSMLATSSKSGFNYSGWSSILMQNLFPQMRTLGVGLNTTNALMGGLSNIGMGPFAAMGMGGIMKLAAGSGTDKQKQALNMVMGSQTGLSEAIKKKGFFGGLGDLAKALERFDGSEKLKIMEELFGGMGTGVAAGLLDNIDMFKDLEVSLSSQALGKLIQVSAANTSSLRFEELGASGRNMTTSLVDTVTSMNAFQNSVLSLTTAFKSVGDALSKVKKWGAEDGFGKGVSGIFGTALNLGTGYLGGMMLGNALPRLYKSTNFLLGGENQKVTAALGKAGPIFGAIGLVVSGLSMIHGSIESFFNKQTQKTLDDLNAREVAVEKYKNKMPLTEKDIRMLMGLGRMNYSSEIDRARFDKKMERDYNKTIKIDITVNGNGHLDSNGVTQLVEGMRQQGVLSTMSLDGII